MSAREGVVVAQWQLVPLWWSTIRRPHRSANIEPRYPVAVLMLLGSCLWHLVDHAMRCDADEPIRCLHPGSPYSGEDWHLDREANW